MKVEHRQIQYPGQQSILNYYVEINGQYFPRPALSLLNRKSEEIVGRTIVGYSFNLGSSGYPGDLKGLGWGFFGLLLQDKENLSRREWLVIAIGSAASYHCLLDSRWIEAVYTEKDMKHVAFKPAEDGWVVFGYPSRVVKDEFTPFIKGATITVIDLKLESCNITLEKNGQKHLLEILNIDPRLCPLPGPYTEQKKIVRHKVFKEGTDHIGNYIIFMEENGQIYV